MSFIASPHEYILISLKQQLAKLQNSSIETIQSVLNLTFIFDAHLTVADQIILSKSCYSHILQLR